MACVSALQAEHDVLRAVCMATTRQHASGPKLRLGTHHGQNEEGGDDGELCHLPLHHTTLAQRASPLCSSSSYHMMPADNTCVAWAANPAYLLEQADVARSDLCCNGGDDADHCESAVGHLQQER